MSSITAVYHVTSKPDEVGALARAIAVEQTVEVPEGLITEEIDREIVGDVVSIEAVADNRFAIRIDYAADLVNGFPALLNLIYGNVSMMFGVRLAELELPEQVLRLFPGPNFGCAGLRDLLGVHGRPLLATVLKPRGAGNARFREIVHEFALAGGDIVKDDNNLFDADVDAFRERASMLQDAVREANAKTGRNCLYLANLCAPMGELERYAECAVELGVRGALMPPMILGLDTVRDLAQRHGLIIMGHPAGVGVYLQDRLHGIDPGVLMGTLYRLAGVDISIFVNHAGRFGYSREECARIAAACRAPLGALATCYPAPAGGMHLDRFGDMADEYGADTTLVVGGALLGDARGVRAVTETWLARIRDKFDERLSPPYS